MSDKPDLTLIDMEPLDKLPKESLEDFRKLVLDQDVKPSVALRQIMEKYNCSTPHVSTVVRLLDLTYPNVDMARFGFSFRIVDSGYPNSIPSQFSDDDFDKGIEEILASFA